MKLLIYSLNYYPEPTGIGKYSGEMAEWFAERGHEVEVICGLPHYPQWRLDPDYVDGRSRIERLAGVNVRRASHFIPTSNSLNTRARIRLETSFSLSSIRYWLPKLFNRHKPDAVIAIMPPMQIGIWPLFYNWMRRVPWILHIQDLQVDAALKLNMLSGSVIGKLLYRIETFLLKRADRVSTITETMRQRIIDKGTYPDYTILFPNWTDIERIQPGKRNNNFRKELGIGPQTNLVLYAGNMGQKQGLSIVIDAAKQLRTLSKIQFLMVGDGADRANLEQQVRSLGLDNLRFLPVQPLERLSEMLAAGDIHLVIQKRDAADLVMPSKLTNILSAGRPCIATTEPGTALFKVVYESGTGLVIPPENSTALAKAIQTLSEDAELRDRCGKSARAYAENHLDRDSILSAFENDLFTLTGKYSHD